MASAVARRRGGPSRTQVMMRSACRSAEVSQNLSLGARARRRCSERSHGITRTDSGSEIAYGSRLAPQRPICLGAIVLVMLWESRWREETAPSRCKSRDRPVSLSSKTTRTHATSVLNSSLAVAPTVGRRSLSPLRSRSTPLSLVSASICGSCVSLLRALQAEG
jgi:hypothetical protein